MVQVDVVWAYAFGAGFAANAARQLEKEDNAFTNKWFVISLLFLAILFGPSGVYLLWEFVQWETMQVAKTYADIPAWLVCGFAVTNITQGILGFWIGYRLVKNKRYYAAHANWMWAWILFWFLLVCGWDGTGYQRFLYDASVHGGELWVTGKHMGLAFFWKSRVWWTLVVMGFFFAPVLIYSVVNFIPEGARRDPSLSGHPIPGPFRLLAASLGAQWAVCLGLAIAASLLVMGLRSLFGTLLLGYLTGVPLFVIAAQLLLFRNGMPLQRLAQILYIKAPEESWNRAASFRPAIMEPAIEKETGHEC